MNKWALKETDNVILGKMAVLLKSSKCVQYYESSQRQFCASNYKQQQYEYIVERGRFRYQSPDFGALLQKTPQMTDKVCRIYKNLAELIITALEVIGLKTTSWNRIHYFLKVIKGQNDEVKRKTKRQKQTSLQRLHIFSPYL